MLIVEKAMYVWGHRVDGKSLCFPVNFVVKLKLL